MAERRTEVVIDLTVDHLELPEGPLRIPAEVQVEGGGGGGVPGGGPGGGGGRPRRPWVPVALGGGPPGGAAGAGELAAMRGALEGIFGTSAAGAMMGRIEQMVGGVGRLGVAIRGLAAAAAPVLPFVAVLLAGVAAAAGAIWLQMKAVTMAWPYLKAAGLAALSAIILGTEQVVQALGRALLGAIQASIDGLGNLVRAGIQAGEALLEGLGQAFQHVWDLGVAAMEALGRAVAQFVKTATATFAEFEQSVANAVTAMGRFGEAGMALRTQVEDAMKAITTNSRKMAYEAAEAAYEIASAGFSNLNEVVAMTQASIVLAEATLSDLHDTAKTVVTTITQFGLSGLEAARIVNVFAAAIRNSLIQLPDLTVALSYVGSAARIVGMSLEETTAAIMGLSKAGILGSKAGRGLAMVLATLMRETPKAAKALASVGLTMADLDPTKKGILGVVKTLEGLKASIGEAATSKLLANAFPVQVWRTLMGLLATGSAEMERMRAAITGTSDAERMQRDQIMTLSGWWMKLKSMWENVYYDVLQGGLSPALQWVLKLLRDMIGEGRRLGIFTQFGAILGQIVMIAYRLIAALGPGLLKTLQAIVGMLPAVVAQIAGAAAGLQGPLLAFIGGLPGLFGAVVQTVLPIILRLVVAVGNALGQVPALLTGIIAVLGPLASRLVGMLASGIEALPGLIRGAIGLMGPIVQAGLGALPAIIGFVQTAFQTLGPVIINLARTAFPLLVQFAQTVGPLLISFFAALLPQLTTFLSGSGSQLVAWFGLLLNAGIRLLQGLAMFQPAMSGLINLFMGWAPVVADIALQQLPVLVAAVYRLLPAITELADTALPVLLQILQDVAYMIRDKGAPFIEGLLMTFMQLADMIMTNWPMIAILMQMGLSLIQEGLTAASYLMETFGGTFSRVLEWLQANFRPIVIGVIDVLVDFISIIQGLIGVIPLIINAFLALNLIWRGLIKVGQIVIAILGALVLALGAVATVTTLLTTGSKKAAGETWTMVKGLHQGLGGVLAMGDKAIGMLKHMPGALRTIGADAEIGLGKAKEGLRDIKAEMERLHAAEAGGMPGAGAVGTPQWPSAAGGQQFPRGSAGVVPPPGNNVAVPAIPGLGGTRLTPAGNTYQANFYPTDWAAMRAAYDNWERQGKEREERAGRTRGPLR